MQLAEIEKIEGWLSLEVIQLLIHLNHIKPLGTDALEVGSWKGKSSISIASSLKSKERLHCIDTFKGSKEHRSLLKTERQILPDFKRNILKAKLKSKIQIHIGTSLDAKDKISNKIGLVFIDGSHEYADVLLDYKLWFSKLEPGGYIAFHDAKWPGVKKVLWEELFLLKNVGLIQRVEDTIFCKKLHNINHYFYFLNSCKLRIYKFQHAIKRIKRKIKKCLKTSTTYNVFNRNNIPSLGSSNNMGSMPLTKLIQ